MPRLIHGYTYTEHAHAQRWRNVPDHAVQYFTTSPHRDAYRRPARRHGAAAPRTPPRVLDSGVAYVQDVVDAALEAAQHAEGEEGKGEEGVVEGDEEGAQHAEGEDGVGPALTAIFRAILKHLKMPKIPTEAYSWTMSVPPSRRMWRRAVQLLSRLCVDWQTWGYDGRCLCVDLCRIASVCAVSLFRVRGTGKSQSHAIMLCVCLCVFSRTIFGHKEVPRGLSP